MALEYYTPGVYVEEVSSGSKNITAVPSSILGFIGEANQGVTNKVFMITSWDQYFDEFIGYKEIDKVTPRGTVVKDSSNNIVKEQSPNFKSTHLDWSVYTFFSNGGGKCYIVNVRPSTLESKSESSNTSSTDNKNDFKPKTSPLLGSQSKKSFDLMNAIIGNDGGPSKRTGIHCFKDADEISIISAPGVIKASIQQEILIYCENHNIFSILDAPESFSDLKSYGLSEDLSGLSQLSSKCASKQAAIYFPWINVYNPETKKDISLPPSGFIAGIYSRVDNQRGVHKAPANEVVRLATSLAYTISDKEQETLNQKGINCIRNFSDMGIRVWGARTTICAIDSEWKYINVRRLFNLIEKSIEEGTKWAVFEPNVSLLWTKIRSNINSFLNRIYNSGALAGNSAQDAFYVKCDASTNSQDNIDAGIVTIEIGIAPVKPAEFIVFKISQKSPGAEEAAE